MAVVFWAEAGLSNSSEVRQIDDWSFSLQTNLRGALDDEHLFSSSTGTADRGIHRVGSGRAFVAAQSALSTSNTTQGRLFFASNTSRLFVTPVSGATAFVGGPFSPEVLSKDGAAYYSQNVRFVMQSGNSTAASGNAVQRVGFPTTYETVPTVTVTPFRENITGRHVTINLVTVGGSVFSYQVLRADDSQTTDTVQFHWLSLGTVGF